MENISYKKISQRMLNGKIPFIGEIEITHRCNLKCKHCYINCPMNDKELSNKELSYEEICYILEQISSSGCLFLKITGGEPLVRPDFIDIYTYAKRKGFIITLGTNGTLITPEIAMHIQEYPPLKVEISLYGVTKNTYENVTNVEGSFEQCMNSIHLLTKKGIPLMLIMPLMTINKHEFEHVRKFAMSVNAEFCYGTKLCPRIDGSKKIDELRLTPEEVVKFGQFDERTIKYVKERQKYYIIRAKYLYACRAGEIYFRITPYGQLIMCALQRSTGYNLLNGSFQKGLEFLKNIRSKEHSDDYKCAKCEYRSLCDICPEISQLENTDPEAPVEYLCNIAKLQQKYLR